MAEALSFLLTQKSLKSLKNQKIYNEVVNILHEIEDQDLVDVLGFNPNK